MLNIDSIDVYYGSVQALWKVSLTVAEGEITVVVGSNGAGKTTLLKTISGLLHPKSGNIFFFGKKIDKAPPYEIVKMGIAHVPEGRHLFPYMTVEENLEMGAHLMRDKQEIAETLDWVYQIFPILKERRNQLARTLSGGEQQMLAIGRGLMSKPKLLMLDEPSLGLAPKLVLQVFDLVKKINNDEGITILLVEQNVRQALQIAHKAYVLENGRIIMEDKGQELLHNEHVKKAYLGL